MAVITIYFGLGHIKNCRCNIKRIKFDKNLATIHGYLCSDGYVIKNPPEQKQKYYHIGLRNTNEVLLKDFQTRFNQYFKIEPHITKNVDRCRIGSKEIYYFLTREYSYYCHECKLPKLPKTKLKFWLRAFFDAEGWVECQEAKSRSVRVECAHFQGLESVKRAVEKFSIKVSTIKKKKDKNSWYINICGLDDIKKFRKEIGFLHPRKAYKLDRAINSYKNYYWEIPDKIEDLINFIKVKGKIRYARNEIRLNTIKKTNLKILKDKLSRYNIKSKLGGPWKSGTGSIYYCLTLKISELKLSKTL